MLCILFSIMVLIPSFVCFIVNLSVADSLSWFYIVVGGCLLAYSIIFCLLYFEKYPLLWSLLCLSIYIFPYLLLIEGVVNNFFLKTPIHFTWELAFPIAAIWLLVCWIGVLLYRLSKLNIFYCFTIIGFLAIPASVLTNHLAGHYNDIILSLQDNMINNFTMLFISISCLISGIMMESKKKKQVMENA